MAATTSGDYYISPLSSPLPFALSIRTAKTGKFYVVARSPTGQLFGRWVFYKAEETAKAAMYEIELARMGRTWTGPVGMDWKEIGGISYWKD